MNPIALAIHGKGIRKAAERAVKLVMRYGFNSSKMDRALAQFVDVLHRFDCGATFPITSVAVKRHPDIVRKYQDQGIEFAIHGFRHLDHSELSYEEQKEHFDLAIDIFRAEQIRTTGFRGPYLRWNGDTLLVLTEDGLQYDSSQSLTWDVIGDYETEDYQHVLQFYGALSATNYPALPSLENDVVRIPYSLPDDEALVERLNLDPEEMVDMWLSILHRTHRLGELFTIGLHPERIALCQEALEAVLTEVSQMDPPIWVARLDEISTWWRKRSQTEVEITDVAEGEYRLMIKGTEGVTILARGVEVEATVEPWGQSSYQRVQATDFIVTAPKRPFIGLSPLASSKLADFLRQQGYIIEYSDNRKQYPYYFDQPQFVSRHKRFLLAQIEGADFPLVRLWRWPHGHKSAVSVTGDIDALTMWDYIYRLFGK